MRLELWMLVVGGLLLAQGVRAEDARGQWDDSHMRSRHQAMPPSTRPRFEGMSGYAALASGTAETKTEVASELEFTSQREWTQGVLSSASRPADADPGNRPRGAGTGAGRRSALRAAAVHSGR